MCQRILIVIGSGHGLSSVQCQVITWTNDDSLSVGLLEIKMKQFSFRKVCFKIGSNMAAIWFWPQCVNPSVCRLLSVLFSCIVQSFQRDRPKKCCEMNGMSLVMIHKQLARIYHAFCILVIQYCPWGSFECISWTVSLVGSLFFVLSQVSCFFFSWVKLLTDFVNH